MGYKSRSEPFRLFEAFTLSFEMGYLVVNWVPVFLGLGSGGNVLPG